MMEEVYLASQEFLSPINLLLDAYLVVGSSLDQIHSEIQAVYLVVAI